MSEENTSLDAEELYAKALELVLAAQRMIALARSLESPSSELLRVDVDFDALPGRSAESRAEALYGGRRIRNRMFPTELFGEPAWDILLLLFLADRKGKVLTCAEVRQRVGIPGETAARWLGLMEAMDLVERSGPIGDDDVRTAKLTIDGLERMAAFFALTEGRVSEPQYNRQSFQAVASPRKPDLA